LLSSKKQKKNHADKIKKSMNKNKTIWDILELETNKAGNSDKATTLNTYGASVSNCIEFNTKKQTHVI
jgi:hypothetical protein